MKNWLREIRWSKSIPLKTILRHNFECRCPNPSLKHKFNGGEWTDLEHQVMILWPPCIQFLLFLFSDDQIKYSQAMPGFTGHYTGDARGGLPLSPRWPPLHFEPFNCAMVETRALKSSTKPSLISHGGAFAPQWSGEFTPHPTPLPLQKTPFASPPPTLSLQASKTSKATNQCSKAIKNLYSDDTWFSP